MSNLQEQRNQCLHEHLATRNAYRPPSVFDPVSARIAEHLGLQVGLLGGSVASALILGAPDLALITQTELVAQVRRTTAVGSISLMVDADHGYGNSLNVWRTVRELERAGASGIFLEETILPPPFAGDGIALIDKAEMIAKIAAATSAKVLESTVIVARTDALRLPGKRAATVEETRSRVTAYTRAGADAILIIGVEELDDVRAIREVTDLPLLVGSPLPGRVTDDMLRDAGVSMVMRGHIAFQDLVRSLYVSLSGYLPTPSEGSVAVPEVDELMRIATGTDHYSELTGRFMQAPA